MRWYVNCVRPLVGCLESREFARRVWPIGQTIACHAVHRAGLLTPGPVRGHAEEDPSHRHHFRQPPWQQVGRREVSQKALLPTVVPKGA